MECFWWRNLRRNFTATEAETIDDTGFMDIYEIEQENKSISFNNNQELSLHECATNDVKKTLGLNMGDNIGNKHDFSQVLQRKLNVRQVRQMWKMNKESVSSLISSKKQKGGTKWMDKKGLTKRKMASKKRNEKINKVNDHKCSEDTDIPLEELLQIISRDSFQYMRGNIPVLKNPSINEEEEEEENDISRELVKTFPEEEAINLGKYYEVNSVLNRIAERQKDFSGTLDGLKFVNGSYNDSENREVFFKESDKRNTRSEGQSEIRASSNSEEWRSMMCIMKDKESRKKCNINVIIESELDLTQEERSNHDTGIILGNFGQEEYIDQPRLKVAQALNKVHLPTKNRRRWETRNAYVDEEIKSNKHLEDYDIMKSLTAPENVEIIQYEDHMSAKGGDNSSEETSAKIKYIDEQHESNEEITQRDREISIQENYYENEIMRELKMREQKINEILEPSIANNNSKIMSNWRKKSGQQYFGKMTNNKNWNKEYHVLKTSMMENSPNEQSPQSFSSLMENQSCIDMQSNGRDEKLYENLTQNNISAQKSNVSERRILGVTLQVRPLQEEGFFITTKDSNVSNMCSEKRIRSNENIGNEKRLQKSDKSTVRSESKKLLDINTCQNCSSIKRRDFSVYRVANKEIISSAIDESKKDIFTPEEFDDFEDNCKEEIPCTITVKNSDHEPLDTFKTPKRKKQWWKSINICRMSTVIGRKCLKSNLKDIDNQCLNEINDVNIGTRQDKSMADFKITKEKTIKCTLNSNDNTSFQYFHIKNSNLAHLNEPALSKGKNSLVSALAEENHHEIEFPYAVNYLNVDQECREILLSHRRESTQSSELEEDSSVFWEDKSSEDSINNNFLDLRLQKCASVSNIAVRDCPRRSRSVNGSGLYKSESYKHGEFATHHTWLENLDYQRYSTRPASRQCSVFDQKSIDLQDDQQMTQFKDSRNCSNITKWLVHGTPYPELLPRSVIPLPPECPPRPGGPPLPPRPSPWPPLPISKTQLKIQEEHHQKTSFVSKSSHPCLVSHGISTNRNIELSSSYGDYRMWKYGRGPKLNGTYYEMKNSENCEHIESQIQSLDGSRFIEMASELQRSEKISNSSHTILKHPYLYASRNCNYINKTSTNYRNENVLPECDILPGYTSYCDRSLCKSSQSLSSTVDHDEVQGKISSPIFMLKTAKSEHHINGNFGTHSEVSLEIKAEGKISLTNNSNAAENESLNIKAKETVKPQKMQTAVLMPAPQSSESPSNKVETRNIFFLQTPQQLFLVSSLETQPQHSGKVTSPNATVMGPSVSINNFQPILIFQPSTVPITLSIASSSTSNSDAVFKRESENVLSNKEELEHTNTCVELKAVNEDNNHALFTEKKLVSLYSFKQNEHLQNLDQPSTLLSSSLKNSYISLKRTTSPMNDSFSNKLSHSKSLPNISSFVSQATFLSNFSFSGLREHPFNASCRRPSSYVLCDPRERSATKMYLSGSQYVFMTSSIDSKLGYVTQVPPFSPLQPKAKWKSTDSSQNENKKPNSPKNIQSFNGVSSTVKSPTFCDAQHTQEMPIHMYQNIVTEL